MAGDSISSWFSCPICGDEGETIQARVSSSVNLEFKCTSKEHRLSRSNYSKYRKNEWRRPEHVWKKRELIWNLLFNPDDRVGAGLSSCISCPNCGSSAADGALERVGIPSNIGNHEKTVAGVTTVWCSDCESSAQSWIRVDRVEIDREMIEEKTDFPPPYIE